MMIGVSGASGKLGKAVLAELAKRATSQRIVGISRTPETVAAPAEGRMGDFDRPDSLAEAFAGLDRLLIIPTSALRPGERGAQNVAAVDAAVKAGVGHIVFMSATGTRDRAEPDIFASYFAGEQRLMQTAAKWSILRMNYYAESLGQEAQMSLDRPVLAGIGENRVAFVSRQDVGAAAAGLLTSEGHEGAIYAATGPASLSGAERAAIVAEVTGTPFQYAAVSEADLRAGLEGAGLPADIVNAVVSIKLAYATGSFDIVTGDVEHLSGKPPRSLKDALSAVFAQGTA